MAVTHYDLTATFTDLLGTAYSATSAPVVAWIETNVGTSEAIVDDVANLIGLGPQRQRADSSGVVTFANLVGSDSDAADINIAAGTLQYRVTAEYVNALTRRRGERWSSGWFSLTADTNLADVVAEQYIPATYISQATAALDAHAAGLEVTLDGYADAASTSATAAAASAALAHDISGISTSDGVVEALINDSGSDTSAALTASTADLAVSRTTRPKHAPALGLYFPEAEGAVGDGATDDTVALQATTDAAVAARGTVSLAGGKTYLFSTLNVTAGCKIMGGGYDIRANTAFGDASWGTAPRGTILRSTATTGIAVNVIGSTTFGGFHMADVLIVGPGSGTSKGLSLGENSTRSVVSSTITNVAVVNFSTCVSADKWLDSIVSDLRIRGCEYGLMLGQGAGSTNQNVWINTEVQFSSVESIRADAGYVNRFHGGLLQNISGTAGIHMAGTATTYTFDGFYFEGVTATDAVYFEAGGNNGLRDSRFSTTGGNIRIAGNRATLDKVEARSVTIESGAISTLILSGNIVGTFTDGGTSTVRIQNGTNYFGGSVNFADGLGMDFGASSGLGWLTSNVLGVYTVRDKVNARVMLEMTAGASASAATARFRSKLRIDDALDHDGTTVGFYGVTPATRPAAYTQTYSTADRTLGAYTSDPESVAYTGTPADAASTAKLADLNALRVAYENLRAFTEDLAQQHNALIADLKTVGLIQ